MITLASLGLSVGITAISHSTTKIPVADVDHGREAAMATASQSALRSNCAGLRRFIAVNLAIA